MGHHSHLVLMLEREALRYEMRPKLGCCLDVDEAVVGMHIFDDLHDGELG